MIQLQLPRIAAGIVWCIFLFIGTATASFDDLLAYNQIRFTIDANPDWSELLIVTDLFASRSMLLQKLGHVSGFFILSFILSLGSRNKYGLFFSLGFAVATEILQLYFSRDGRIIDMFIDASGIWAAYFLSRSLWPNNG
ncbi:membrane protein [Paenibacillus darwinianus]|uniref:Membrane protein n=1 Tax=Paenibacillus darwinianus TaxID=1380763 RepID=A0A9W5S2L7_9BACL|nr:VanZ family protein [Paenibacillus darwinianus]EXX91442.1 membrane protein [Paenibacillus darwinianus]